MLPVRVEIVGIAPKTQRFRFETIEDRSLAPTLVAIAALNSLLESGGTGANQTLRWILRLHKTGAAPLTLSDVAAGDAPPFDLAAGIRAPLDFLLNNPFEHLRLDSVAVAVRVEPGREQWTLRNARLLGAAVRPGGTIHLECDVERWRGGRQTTLKVPVIQRKA